MFTITLCYGAVLHPSIRKPSHGRVRVKRALFTRKHVRTTQYPLPGPEHFRHGNLSFFLN